MANLFDDDFTQELKEDLLSSATDGFTFSLDNFGTDVMINNIQSKILVKNKASGSEKEISAKLGDIGVGDTILMNNVNWLVVDLPVENEIYTKGHIRRCNTTFPLKAVKKRILIGHDNDGRPKYSDTFEIKEEPCIASTTYPTGKDNEQLPLPHGMIDIVIKYQQSESLSINENFTIYNQNYEIISIDYTKVINGVGIITIRGQREVGK